MREAWEEHYSRRQAKEAEEQRRKAVKLWRKFAHALLIRDRLKRTYAEETKEKDDDTKATPQLRSIASSSRHVHSFGPGEQDEDGKWSKKCSCGYSVQYEAL